MTKKRYILGIDPGSQTTGYGMIEYVNGKLGHITHGQIQSRSQDLGQRLWHIHHTVGKIIIQYQPTELAMETIFMKSNVQSILKLSHARGAALSACASYALSLNEYAPCAIKRAIVGHGRATKAQVQYMICQILKLQETPQTDAADALAVALTHAQLYCHRLSGHRKYDIL